MTEKDIIELAAALYRTLRTSTTSPHEIGAVLQIVSTLVSLEMANAQSQG